MSLSIRNIRIGLPYGIIKNVIVYMYQAHFQILLSNLWRLVQLFFYTFRYEKDEACYNCLFPNLTENDTLAFSCAQNGIFSPIAGLAGVMQAHIALKEIIGIGKEDKNFILFNGLKNEFKKMKIQKDKSCSVCGEN